MRFKQIRPLTEAQLDELRMSPGSLNKFANSDDAQGIMAGFEAELVFTGLGNSNGGDLEPDYDYDERTRGTSIDDVINFFGHDDWGYGISPRQERELQNSLDDRYMEWYDEAMYAAWKDEEYELIKEAVENEWDWDEQTEEYLNNMGLTDEQVQAALEAGEEHGTFNSSAEQRAFLEENPAYEYYLRARETAEEALESLVQQEIDDQGKYYEEAIDDFRSNFQPDGDDNWLEQVGYRYMSDIANDFNITWPYMSGGGGDDGSFNMENAERLADDLSEKLGVKAKAQQGYRGGAGGNEQSKLHSSRDAVTWFIEEDSSLDSDDSDNMAVEIVSPPMPLEECLRQMENFFTWAEDNGAYTNSSTSMHMGVSLPYRGGNIDYVKLALFLGDEHVLKEFGRQSNHYCQSALNTIKKHTQNKPEKIGSAMELMKHNLLELAGDVLAKSNWELGAGRYSSINKRTGAGYIEFRSAGGENYFEDVDKLKNTLLRYSQAMYIAGNPAAERREYSKKLYKLIAPGEGDSSLDLFARFAAGEISSTELKTQWAEKALAKDAPELVQKGDWVVIDQGTGRPVQGQEYRGFSRDDARARAKQKLSPGSSDEGFDMGYDVVPIETGRWEIYTKDSNTGEENTLEIVDADRKGEAVDKVYDKYVSQDIPFFARAYYGAGIKQPEPKLTRRAQLAKNIKAAPAEEIKNWLVYDTLTGEEHYNQPGRKSNLVQIMRKMERDNKWPQGRLAIKLSSEPPKDELANTQKQADSENYRGAWDFFYVPDGKILDRVDNASVSQATAILADLTRRFGGVESNYGMRRARAPQ